MGELSLRDLILLITYLSKDGYEASCLATRLHKIAFLAKMTFKSLLRSVPEPEPGPYGPYFKEIAPELEKMRQEGLVEIQEVPRVRETEKDTGIMRYIVLTDRGREEAEKLIRKMEQNEDYRKLKEFIQKYASMRLWDLLWLVYSLYPEYTEKSRIRDRVYRYA